MDRVQETMGMLATVINGMALQGALEDKGMLTRLQTALAKLLLSLILREEQYAIEKENCDLWCKLKPYFTTDTACFVVWKFMPCNLERNSCGWCL
jgi:uridylate kinase